MSDQIIDPTTPGETTHVFFLSPTCPFCHTRDDTVTTDAVRAGAEWTCTRCGQRWDMTRLATADAYARFDAARR